MRRLTTKALDVGAGVVYAFAAALDVVADWLTHYHRQDS